MNAPESIGGATRLLFRNASTTPMIMRESPFGGWEEARKQYRGEGFKGNVATAHGHQHEDAARQAAANVLKMDLAGPIRLTQGDYAASLDDRSKSGSHVLEIKCPFKGKKSPIWRSVMDFADPSYYRSQLQHQLMVSGAESAILFIYDAESGDYCWCEEIPNAHYQAEIRAAWDQFWIWKDTDEPDPADGWIVRADNTWHDTAREYLRWKKEMESAKAEMDAYKQRLIDLAEGDRMRGAGLTLVRSERKGSVDYSKVPQLAGVDLEQFRGESTEVWTLNLEKGKK